jgi:hypothetical protein
MLGHVRRCNRTARAETKWPSITGDSVAALSEPAHRTAPLQRLILRISSRRFHWGRRSRWPRRRRRRRSTPHNFDPAVAGCGSRGSSPAPSGPSTIPVGLDQRSRDLPGSVLIGATVTGRSTLPRARYHCGST